MSNGDLSNVWMMGASLNPGSAMAKEMSSVLQNEIEAHSAYDAAGNKNLVGVPLPGKRRVRQGEKRLDVVVDLNGHLLDIRLIKFRQT